MSSFADISIRFQADLKQFSGQMENATRSMKKLGQKMQKTGKNLSVGLTVPLTALGALSVKTFADFEQELAKVQAISGATGKQMEALRKNAEDLGATTRFAASEVAALQLNLSKLGFSPDEILKSTDAILNLALATGEDLGQSATVAASTIRGFGLEASEAGRVADVMAASFSSSALDLNKFQTAMSTVAPVAATAGQTIEDVTGQLSVLVNAGIDAGTAGTGLRNILLDVAKSGGTVEDALNKIRNSSNKNATAMELFGKRGATVATVLADNADAAADFTAQYKNAEGSAKKMAAIMDNTLQGSFFKLKSAAESAAIAIGEELAPIIRGLADRLADLIARFKDLEPATKRFIVIAGALAAAIGPVLVGLGFLMTNVIPGLITAFGALKIAIAATPIGLLVTVAAAAAAAMLLLSNNTKKAAETQSTFRSLTAAATKSVAQEKAELERLLFVARDENVSKEQRVKAIKELNKISPKYLGFLNLENINTTKAKDAVEDYTKALIENARVKAAEEKLVEVQKRIIENELALSGRRQKVEGERLKTLKELEASGLSAAQAETALSVAKQLLAADTADLNKALKEEEKLLLSIVTGAEQLTGANKKVIEGLLTDLPTGGERPKLQVALEIEPLGAVGINDTVKALEDQLRVLQLTRESYQASSQEYQNLTQAIDLTRQSLDDLKAGFQGELVPESFFNTDVVDRMAEKMQHLREVAEAVGDGAATAFESFAGRFVDSLGLADTGFQGFIKGLAQTVIKLISMMLAQSLSQAIAGATASGTATGPAAVFTTPAFIATAIGGILSAFASIPKFASGGLAYGPTLGLMGEYAGASSNPEVIAPLSKLKSLLGDTGAVFIPDARISGNDIVISYERTQARNNRLK